VTTEPRVWITSSYSNNGGQCVEWAPARTSATGTVPVRDSKTPAGPVLEFPTPAFTAFISGVKGGSFGTV
jgi:hypothetical protein